MSQTPSLPHSLAEFLHLMKYGKNLLKLSYVSFVLTRMVTLIKVKLKKSDEIDKYRVAANKKYHII